MLISFVIACMLTSLLTFFLGFFVYLKGRNKKINCIWAITSISIGLWSLGLGMMSRSNTQSEATFWLIYIHYLGAIFIPPCFLHFVLALLGIDNKKRKIIYFGYIISLGLQIANFSGNLAKSVPLPPFRFYTKPELFYPVFTIFFFICVIYLILLLYIGFKKSIGVKRNQIKYMLLATVVGFSGGSTAFFPVFNINIFPYGIYIVSLYPLIMAYAIVQHKLMDINVIVKRAFVYSMLASSIVIIFTTTAISFEYVFKRTIGYKSFTATIFVALLISIIFQPLYKWFSSIVDKTIFKGSLPKIADELQKAEKLAALGVLASGLAHDIKNPLAPIKTYIQNLPYNANDPKYIDKISKIIPIEIDKITDTINQLRDFANPPPLSITKVNLHDLIDKRLNLLDREFKTKNIIVEKQYSPTLPGINADSIQLERVFINLFLNAIDAMPNGGKLTISTEQSGNQVLVKVSDTGIGIAKEDLPHIFDLFYSKDKYKGMGLGLAVTYKIIKEHNGQIRVESAQRKGTVFHVFLPVI